MNSATEMITASPWLIEEETEIKDFEYKEFSGEWEKDFDPVAAESPFQYCYEPFRMVATLLKWAEPVIKASDDASKLLNDLGCDCSFIVSSVHEVPRGSLSCDGKYKPIVDFILKVNPWSTTCFPVYYQDGELSVNDLAGCLPYDYRDDDKLIVCRKYEQNMGNGVKWFEISPAQCRRILRRWVKWAKCQKGSCV